MARNKTAKTMVAVKMNFSAPLFVLYSTLLPPRDEPNPLPFCYSKIPATKRTDNMI